MDIVMFICFTIIGLSLFMIVRTSIISKIRLKAIDISSELDLREIRSGLTYKNRLKAFNAGQSFDSMIFDLTKWSLKQCYPDLLQEYTEQAKGGIK